MTNTQQALRTALGLQCPSCFGVRIEILPRMPHDLKKAQCQECGEIWRIKSA